MALFDDFRFEQPDRPVLRLVDGATAQPGDEPIEELVSNRAENDSTTYAEGLKQSVYGWLEAFRNSGQGYSNDEAFGRHGITVGTPDDNGFAADYAYVTVPGGGYYRIEQYRQDELPVATYVSLIEDDGTFYPPAGVVLEGHSRSVNNPLGYGTSPEPSELPSDILAQFSHDLQHRKPE